jgi:hypothetical protein
MLSLGFNFLAIRILEDGRWQPFDVLFDHGGIR